MKLYELANQYQALLDYAPQISDDPQAQEVFEAAIAGLQDEYSDKLESCAKVLTMLRAEETMLKGEIERLRARSTAIGNSADRLRQYMQATMEAVGAKAFKTPLFSVWIQDNPPAVAVDNEKAIPKKFWTKPDPVLSKALILEALKAGESVPGVHLTVGQSLRVR